MAVSLGLHALWCIILSIYCNKKTYATLQISCLFARMPPKKVKCPDDAQKTRTKPFLPEPRSVKKIWCSHDATQVPRLKQIFCKNNASGIMTNFAEGIDDLPTFAHLTW
ncbi:hypothetical protein SK128_025262 [Halocaridina rubra]|uniref:Secreted protein n=1 Tax=Halocaridina rubra TaxID=373956 RepID=A0AAN8WCZ8_HALRR